jgi:WD40 repeat protein
MAAVVGGTINCQLPIVLSHDGLTVIAVSGTLVKIVSAKTGLTMHTLRPPSSTGDIVGLFTNARNHRQLVVPTSSGAVLFFDVEDGVLLRQTTVAGKQGLARMVQAGERVFYLTRRSEGKMTLGSLNLATEETTVLHVANTTQDPAQQTLVAAPTGDYVAWWHKNDVFVFEVKRSALTVRNHKTDVQAAAFHPRRPHLAIGDRSGRIFIWHALDGASSGITEQMHWHAHGVHSLLFSGEDGSQLLSGGVEDAVVIWQLETRRKVFVPHLGSLGVHCLAASGNGRAYACVCADNSLFVISSHDWRVSRRIMGLRTMGANLLRTYTRLLASPEDGQCLVFTGKPNTLQWYNVEQDACEHELTVLHAAVVPRGRLPVNQKVNVPSRVELSAFGRLYLATLDVRTGNKRFKVTTERTLKLWRPKSSGLGYELACVVLRPHRKLVSSIAGCLTRDEFCSTSLDGTWKLWRLFVNDQGETSVACVHSRSFKGLRPSTCAFSSDGSVLCVMYQGSVLTLWNAVSGDLLHVLSVVSPYLKTVAVAAVPSTSLIVGLVHSAALWCVDALTCAVRWRLAVKVTDMAVHSSSGHIAFIDTSGWVSLIHASSPVPLWSQLAASDALRVQFVHSEGRPVRVAVLTKTGLFHLFEAPQIAGAAPGKSRAAPTAATGKPMGRFEGLLGDAAPPGEAVAPLLGRNNVRFAATFLADTASHVLPPTTVMLTALLDELLLKKPVAAERDEEQQQPPHDELLGTVLDLDDEAAEKRDANASAQSDKLPHHFSSEARAQLVKFFQQQQPK